MQDITIPSIYIAQAYNIIVGLHPDELQKWCEEYKNDTHFMDVIESLQEPNSHIMPRYPQYQYSDDGLIFFEDNEGNSRLCIPQALRTSVMDQVHNSVMESTHGG
ncbi:hypothetical protein IW262DRAFT_1264969, partial [Armillaria fumosa]